MILHPTELTDLIQPIRIAYGRIDYVVRLIVIARIDGGATTGAGYGHVIREMINPRVGSASELLVVR